MLLQYSQLKNDLGLWANMSEDLIHVHAGLAIFVVTALLLRRRMRSVVPLTVVAVLALANEVVDYQVGTGWESASSALDFVNSLFWPLILFLLARRGRGPETVR